MVDYINIVREANNKRDVDNLDRRLLKLQEELGEASQAYLNVTSGEKNKKNKTWEDVREEVVDCFIVALDLMLTELPDCDDAKEHITKTQNMFLTKMNKWNKQISSNNDITQ